MRSTRLPHRSAAAVTTTAAALALSTPALAADAVYGGTSGSGDAIVLKSDRTSTTLRSITVSWRATCDDGSRLPGTGTLTPTAATPGFSPGADELIVSQNANGRFKGSQLTMRDFEAQTAVIALKAEGRLKPKRASGSLTVDVTITDKATQVPVTHCRATQRWSAARVPGVVYGGATSQSAPFVIRLDASRTIVEDVYLGWFAPCTSGGTLFGPDHLIRFPVKPRGAFGNVFHDVATVEGGVRNYDYAFKGNVGIKSAKGSLQIKTVDIGGAGTPVDTCDTGGVTWKATTG